MKKIPNNKLTIIPSMFDEDDRCLTWCLLNNVGVSSVKCVSCKNYYSQSPSWSFDDSEYHIVVVKCKAKPIIKQDIKYITNTLERE